LNPSPTVKDLVAALDTITGGRVITCPGDVAGANPFVVTKSSHIPGKAVTEMPGLVCGDMNQPVRRVAVMMTLTESAIELAGASGVDAIVAHHPIADAANSGGVLLKTYLGLYHVSVLELHEAFHGLHPGIAYLHGHNAYHVDIQYSNIPGNILFLGEPLPGVNTLGDILQRIDGFMDFETETALLDREREIRNCPQVLETAVSTRGKIIIGNESDTVGHIIHIFPHTGFTPIHLERIFNAHPTTDTVLATISRVYPGNALIDKALELGLKFICGNSHALEILENGLPLARAIQMLMPDVEVMIFKERMISIPLDRYGSPQIQAYATQMAQRYLVNKTASSKGETR
jgi:hypothetical protein